MVSMFIKMIKSAYLWADLETPDTSTASRRLVLVIGAKYIDLHIGYSAGSLFARYVEPRIEGNRYCVAY